ncbi:MAG: M20 family metallopeptidase [Akkermansiaceae bacterium]|jgi:acetylornithine deacetylase/succinyl-diaminopimelate desuccinylase-like protein|nr:M20 family metallopeptidase [Akkermansiaceae bacterium]MDP4996277.1 M20 family metallopeptidase [Akkermansiaceae bacterium]
MLLQDLIRIPSVNPDNAHPDEAEFTHEEKMAAYLSDWLTDIGATVTLEEIAPRRPNLIARFAPLDGRPRILLGPHLDTVGITNMTIPPFSGDIRDGKIWGRGASDTKGPMAAMLAGLAENKDLLAELPVAVDFVAFMGEEASQHGSKHFARHHADEYAFAIVGEPTSMQVVHTTKGSLWATLSATGTSAHASQPHLGDNAILKLSRALLTLQENLAPALATFTHPVLGGSTLNIGTITGGTAPNIVPNLASAQIDIRQTPTLHAAGGGLKLVRDTIESLGLPLEISHAHENPPMETDPANPFIQKLLATDPRTKTTGAPWFSDAAHLAAAGLPSICIGPGSIDQAHTKDEFLDLDLLRDGEIFFTNFIRSLAD